MARKLGLPRGDGREIHPDTPHHSPSRFQWMTCPRTDLSIRGWLECDPSDLYRPTAYRFGDLKEYAPQVRASLVRCRGRGQGGVQAPNRGVSALDSQTVLELLRPAVKAFPGAAAWVQGLVVHAEPMQWHAAALAIFASIIGPFGGFFASGAAHPPPLPGHPPAAALEPAFRPGRLSPAGFKRAVGVKDFADTFPGHGGMTDRVDCQLMMAVFSYVYYHNFVADPTVSGTGPPGCAAEHPPGS